MPDNENQLDGQEVLISVGPYKDQWGVVIPSKRVGVYVVQVDLGGMLDSSILSRDEFRTKEEIEAANRSLEDPTC